MKPCQRYKDSILRLFDEELGVHGRKELEHHLKECGHCNHFLNQMRLIRSHLRELPQINASENFHILVRERIRRYMARKGRLYRHGLGEQFTKRWIPALGLTVVLAVVGIWMLDQGTSPINLPEAQIGENRSSSPFGRNYGGQIQYVIDDYYPNRISVSRQDKEREPKLTTEDSVLIKENLELMRNRMTPVSF